METVTVAASSGGSSFSEMELLVWSAVVVAVIAASVVTGLKHFKGRNAHRA